MIPFNLRAQNRTWARVPVVLPPPSSSPQEKLLCSCAIVTFLEVTTSFRSAVLLIIQTSWRGRRVAQGREPGIAPPLSVLGKDSLNLTNNNHNNENHYQTLNHLAFFICINCAFKYSYPGEQREQFEVKCKFLGLFLMRRCKDGTGGGWGEGVVVTRAKVQRCRLRTSKVVTDQVTGKTRDGQQQESKRIFLPVPSFLLPRSFWERSTRVMI